MVPVEVFILRQKTRPTEEECSSFFVQCLAQDKERLSQFLRERGLHPQMAIRSANLNKETDDIDEQLEAFIRSEGGAKYYNDTKRFTMETYGFASGEHGEATRLAIIFVSEAQTNDGEHLPAVEEFLARGMRWQELKRWGDALACYRVGLVLYPEQPELLRDLGAIQMRYPKYLVQAHKNLSRANVQNPADGMAMFHLGRCYRVLADTKEVEIKGRPREDLRQMALGLLERAAVSEPDKPEIGTELDSLRAELGIRAPSNKKQGFFG